MGYVVTTDDNGKTIIQSDEDLQKENELHATFEDYLNDDLEIDLEVFKDFFSTFDENDKKSEKMRKKHLFSIDFSKNIYYISSIRS